MHFPLWKEKLLENNMEVQLVFSSWIQKSFLLITIYLEYLSQTNWRKFVQLSRGSKIHKTSINTIAY